MYFIYCAHMGVMGRMNHFIQWSERRITPKATFILDPSAFRRAFNRYKIWY